jgi:hypothetical protein
LELAGITLTKAELNQAIDSSPVLRAHFREGNGVIVHDLTLTEREALSRGTAPYELIQSDPARGETMDRDQAIAAAARLESMFLSQGLEAMGFDEEGISDFFATTSVVARAFGKTVDYAHGSTLQMIRLLKERAQRLHEELNAGDEVVKRVCATKEGPVEYDGPRLTEEERTEKQKVFNGLIAELRQISKTFNESAKIRLEAESLALRREELELGGKPKPKLASGPKQVGGKGQ